MKDAMNIIKNCPASVICNCKSEKISKNCIIKQAIYKLQMIQQAVNIDLLNEALDLFEIEEAEDA